MRSPGGGGPVSGNLGGTAPPSIQVAPLFVEKATPDSPPVFVVKPRESLYETTILRFSGFTPLFQTSIAVSLWTTSKKLNGKGPPGAASRQGSLTGLFLL